MTVLIFIIIGSIAGTALAILEHRYKSKNISQLKKAVRENERALVLVQKSIAEPRKVDLPIRKYRKELIKLKSLEFLLEYENQDDYEPEETANWAIQFDSYQTFEDIDYNIFKNKSLIYC